MNNITDELKALDKKYRVTQVIDLDICHDIESYKIKNWIQSVVDAAHKSVYNDNERVIFTLSRGDIYNSGSSQYGQILYYLQQHINTVDISNFFVILLTTDETLLSAYTHNFQQLSRDPVPIEIILCAPMIRSKQVQQMPSKFDYNSREPLKIKLENLSDAQQELLTRNPTFCMYPWIHVHAYPTGDAYPCCMADMDFPVGNLRENSMAQVWNDAPMKNMRLDMLAGRSVNACTRCYEQEANGFMSGRLSANKHHGHHVNRVAETQLDGTLDRFELVYWDIRFSNLCNLSCRSCGHIFSSSWYQDQVKLAGPEWAKNNRVLNYAGRYETDAWEQLVQHIDHVEQIYFAGGEPLMMDEHYRILEELERRGRFDVRLIYNTNFTHVKLKDRLVFDYWRKFASVSVGASLDAMGPRAEYIRRGTNWAVVEENRSRMMEICPGVDFYISPTLSILNAWHLPDFHQEWVKKGLIKPQDLNVNVLQDPPYYRIDIAPIKYKQRLRIRYEEHIEWLKDRDPLGRASKGFESAINFMMNIDNSQLIGKFWHKTRQLDAIRKENLLEVIPELEALDADSTQ